MARPGGGVTHAPGANTFVFLSQMQRSHHNISRMNTQGKHSDPLCRKKKDDHWRRLLPHTNGQPNFHLKAAQATPRKEVDLQHAFHGEEHARKNTTLFSHVCVARMQLRLTSHRPGLKAVPKTVRLHLARVRVSRRIARH